MLLKEIRTPDNYKLSFIGGFILNVPEDINNLTPEQFEQICIKLLKKNKTNTI